MLSEMLHCKPEDRAGQICQDIKKPTTPIMLDRARFCNGRTSIMPVAAVKAILHTDPENHKMYDQNPANFRFPSRLLFFQATRRFFAEINFKAQLSFPPPTLAEVGGSARKGRNHVYMSQFSDKLCWIADLVDMQLVDMALLEELAAAANNLSAAAAQQCSAGELGLDIPAVVNMALVLAVADDIAQATAATEDATDQISVGADDVEVVRVFEYYNSTTKPGPPTEAIPVFESMGMRGETVWQKPTADSLAPRTLGRMVRPVLVWAI